MVSARKRIFSLGRRRRSRRPANRLAVMRTRRATPHDAMAIRALIDRFVPDGTLLPRTEAYIAAHADHFLVAEEHGHVVGCVHLEKYSPSIAELRSLAVDPSHHGHGIGRALVLATEALARRREYSMIFAVSN